MSEPREDVEALPLKAWVQQMLDNEFEPAWEDVATVFHGYLAALARLEQTERLAQNFRNALEQMERERDAEAQLADEAEACVQELERALHVAEETLGLETDEDSWISLKRRAEAAERALRETWDDYMTVVDQHVTKELRDEAMHRMIVRFVALDDAGVLASSEGEKKRVLINTRTGERREWEPGLVLQAEGPLEWELREE